MFYPNRLIFEHAFQEGGHSQETDSLVPKEAAKPTTLAELNKKQEDRKRAGDERRLAELEEKLDNLEADRKNPELLSYFSEEDWQKQIDEVNSEVGRLKQKLEAGRPSAPALKELQKPSPDEEAKIRHDVSQALLYLKKGREEAKAEGLYGEAKVLYEKAQALHAKTQGLYEQAQKLLESTVNGLGKNDPRAWLALARVYSESGMIHEMGAAAKIAIWLGVNGIAEEKWERDFLSVFQQNMGFIRIEAPPGGKEKSVALNIELAMPLFSKERKEFYKQLVGGDSGIIDREIGQPFVFTAGAYNINGNDIVLKPGEEVVISYLDIQPKPEIAAAEKPPY